MEYINFDINAQYKVFVQQESILNRESGVVIQVYDNYEMHTIYFPEFTNNIIIYKDKLYISTSLGIIYIMNLNNRKYEKIYQNSYLNNFIIIDSIVYAVGNSEEILKIDENQVTSLNKSSKKIVIPDINLLRSRDLESYFSKLKSGMNIDYYDLIQTKNGFVSCGGAARLFGILHFFDNEMNFKYSSSEFSESITSVVKLNDKYLASASTDALWITDGSSINEKILSNVGSSRIYDSCVFDNNFYVATDDGIYKIDESHKFNLVFDSKNYPIIRINCYENFIYFISPNKFFMGPSFQSLTEVISYRLL